MPKITSHDVQVLASYYEWYYGSELLKQQKHEVIRLQLTDHVDTIKVDVLEVNPLPKLYHVIVENKADHHIATECQCKEWKSSHFCRHCVVAALELAERSNRDSNENAESLLNQYQQQNIQQDHQEMAAEMVDENSVRLEATVKLPAYRDACPELSLKIGIRRMYVVRSVSELVKRVRNHEIFSYGKELNIAHSIEMFNEEDRQLMAFLTAQATAYEDIANQINERISYGYGYRDRVPTQIETPMQLTGQAMDDFFELGMKRSCVLNEKGNQLGFAIRNPQTQLKIQKTGLVYRVTLNDGESVPIYSGKNYHYFMDGNNTLCRIDPAFYQKMKPLLNAADAPILFSERDLTSFCVTVLPNIEDYVTLNDPENLLEKFLPDDCIPYFRLDMKDDTLTCRLTYKYGQHEMMPKTVSPKVRRDTAKEALVESRLSRYLRPTNRPAYYELTGDEAIYTFLVENLQQLQSWGDVFVSDALKAKQIQPKKPIVGISVSGGSLLMDLDTGDFPAEELEALYNSMLLRRKYHKLADGRFMAINGSGYEKLAEAIHMSRISTQELKSGHVSMPASRGLYLDSVFNGEEDIRLQRDKTYREMIRRFKTVSESDDAIPDEFSGVLRGYQETGFRWLKTLDGCGFGGILADEMGLGKTLQVITYLTTVKRSITGKPSLVVCPASLVLNWQDEVKKFAPNLHCVPVSGTAASRKQLWASVKQDENIDLLVTSYDLLKRDIEQVEQMDFYACILDEAQFIKNQTTIGSKAVKRIRADHRYAMTGTPIENRLSELWNIFDFLMPGYLYTHNTFVEKLEKPIVKSEDKAARTQLSKMVQPFLLRRLKKDVLKELPPKMEYLRRVALSEDERKLYAAQVNRTKSTIAMGDGQNSKMQILAAFTRLRQICCDPNLCFENYEGDTSKLEACLELIQSMTENDHQILLFSQFTSMLARIRGRLDEMGISSFTLQGDTSKEKRAELVRAFNNGGAKVFLISLKAGGTGLNLTAADVVIHYDPWWNMAAQNQATDRAHRIGQKSCVQVYKLIAENSIEEKIVELQEKKAALMDAFAAGSDEGILSMNEKDLLALLD